MWCDQRKSCRATKIVGIATVMNVALLGAALAQSGPQTRIGFMADLTGPLAPIGGGLERGVKTVQEMWNAQTDKRKIEITSCDSQSNGAGALSCYQRLKVSVDAFAGPHLFLGLASVRGVAERGPLPVISAAPMAAPAEGAAAGSQMFQDLPTIADGVKAGLAHLKKTGKSRIAILVANDLPGNQTVEAAKSYAEANGITLVRIEQFDPATQSLAPQAENIAAAKPDAVLANIVGPQLIIGLRALKTANIDIPIMLNYASMNTQLLTAADAAAGANLFFFATKSFDRDSITDPGYKDRVQTFDTTFRRLYNQSPDFIAFVAADTAYILAQAGNAPAGPSKIHETLESGMKFDGVLWSSYNFSPTKHTGQAGIAAFDILQWQPDKKSWRLVQ